LLAIPILACGPETANKKKPFEDFINILNEEEQADVFVAIDK